jgi:hypothetical protein
MKGRALLSAAFTLALVALSLGQVTWTKGRAIKGAPGITESVAQIMARPQKAVSYTKEIKYTETQGPDRDNLPQNQASPDSSTYPPRADFGYGPGPTRGPLFSLGNSWLGPIGGGTGSESPYVPPDTMGDVSPTQVIVTVNGRFKIYDRQGNVGALNTDPNTFFQSVRAASMSDPRIRWDRLSQRWYIVMIDVLSTNNRVCIAVSNGPTVTDTSSFTFYQFSYNIGGGNSWFLDYPTIGVDSKALYIGGNIFTSSSGSFTGCDLFVVNKAALLSGTLSVTPFRQICTQTSTNPVIFTGVYTPHGCDNDDPSSNEGYVVGSAGEAFGLLKVRKISDPGGGAPQISSDINITVPATQNGRSVTAFGSTRPLDGLDDRLFAAKIFWNRLTNTPSIWTAHNIRGTSAGVASSTGDRNLSRWYEIRGFTNGGTPSLFQSGTVFVGPALIGSYWIPSIAMNGQGGALLGCSYCTTTTITPNVAVADRLWTDSLGFMNTPVQVSSSTATYNRQTSGTQRWGDYSHTSVDPADGMSIWTFQEYCSATNQWGVRVSRLLAQAPTVTGISPNSFYPYDNVNVTVTGTGLFEPGATYPNHLAAAFSGSGITVNSVTFVNPAQAILNISVAGNAVAGPRTLTMTNPDLQSATIGSNVNARAGSGTVTLGGWTVSTNGVPVTIEIKDASNTVMQTANVNLDASGNFSFVPTIAPGTYTVTAKGSHWLRKAAEGVTITTQGFNQNFTLVNGDVNGDNAVTLGDFADLRAAFGSTNGDANWNPNADLNGDGFVTLADFAILRGNFGQSGG